MGIDSFPGSKRSPREIAKDPLERIDDLLAAFPPETHERLLARMEGKPPEEQAEMLEHDLRIRRALFSGPRYVSERLHMISRMPDGAVSRFEHKEGQVEVGRGENGRVFEYHSPDDQEGGTAVFKMLIRVPLPHQNDLLSEGAYQADVAAFADAHPTDRVGVPHPFYIAGSSKGYVLAMEKVPGHSIADILAQNIRLPETVDLDLIQHSLELFVADMNEAGFYHRDLREGNIIIDPEAVLSEAPLAYIIDFGYCTKAENRAEAYREVAGCEDHDIIKKVMDSLRRKQELLRSEEQL